jgi:hypothetical protein
VSGVLEMKIPIDAIYSNRLNFEAQMITSTMGVQDFSIGFDACVESGRVIFW